jgi:hypothetical protein
MWALASNLQLNLRIQHLTFFSIAKFCIEVPSLCFLDKLSSYFDLLHCSTLSSCFLHTSSPPNAGTLSSRPHQSSWGSCLHLQSSHSWNNEYHRKTHVYRYLPSAAPQGGVIGHCKSKYHEGCQPPMCLVCIKATYLFIYT